MTDADVHTKVIKVKTTFSYHRLQLCPVAASAPAVT